MKRIYGNGVFNCKKIIFIALISILLTMVLGSTLGMVKAASSDTSLKSLTISPSEAGLTQDEDNNKIYRAKVDNNVTSISVNAVPNSSSAQVSVSGNTGLQVGTNKVNVIVTAEDGTSSTYIIYVRRADTSIAEENIIPNVQDGNDEEEISEPEETPSTENVILNEATNETSNEIQNSENANNNENLVQNIETTTTQKSNNKFLYALIAVIFVIVLIIVVIRIKRK